TDLRVTESGGSTVEGRVLADDRAISDDQPGRLPTVLEVLGVGAEHRTLVDDAIRPDRRVLLDQDVRPEPSSGADRDPRPHDRIGTDGDAIAQLDRFVDDCGRVDLHTGWRW